MSRARKLADLLDASGDVRNDAMDNVALSDLNVTATHAELNTLDGITATTAELNIMDGVTATTTEINYLDGVTSNVQTQIDNASTSLSDLSITATATEINTLDGITATTAELNTLDGVTATTAELNYVDGVTSSIQTQIDNIASDLVDDTTPQLGGDLDTNGNDVNFGDNDKAQFGASNDLQIYHDGSNSIIKDAGTGNLKIQGSGQVRIEDASGNVGAVFNANTDAVLKYAGSNKLVTTSTGVDVTGGVTADALDYVDGAATFTSGDASGYARITQTNGSAQLGFFRAGSAAGGMYIGADSYGLRIFNSSFSEKVRIDNNGTLFMDGEGGSNITVNAKAGSAKVWANFDMAGTYATRDSYNVSSLSDNGSGAGTCNYNNDMNNANRSVTGTASTTGSTSGNRQFTVGHAYSGWNVSETAGANRIAIIYGTGGNNAKYDAQYVSQKVHGDLA